MKYYNIPICEAYNKIILEDVSAKILSQAKKTWATTSEEDLKKYLDQYINVLRVKLTPPQNDINFWLKKHFQEFKDFIETYKSNTEKKTHQKYKAQTTKDGKGVKINENAEYELWQVDSHEAAKELGRFYKGYSTDWCISTDNIDYWYTYYYEGNNRVYFLIRKQKQNDVLDKVAILVDEYGAFECWNQIDDLIEDNDEINTFDFFKSSMECYAFDINTKEYKTYELTSELLNDIQYNNFKKVKTAIENGANIHYDDDAPLKYATFYGHLNIVKYLIEKGVDVHAEEDIALKNACINGYLEIVKYLLEKGANIHSNEDDPLLSAAYYGHVEIVKYLVEKGADIHARTNYMLTHKWKYSPEIKEYIKSVEEYF